MLRSCLIIYRLLKLQPNNACMSLFISVWAQPAAQMIIGLLHQRICWTECICNEFRMNFLQYNRTREQWFWFTDTVSICYRYHRHKANIRWDIECTNLLMCANRKWYIIEFSIQNPFTFPGLFHVFRERRTYKRHTFEWHARNFRYANELMQWINLGSGLECGWDIAIHNAAENSTA